MALMTMCRSKTTTNCSTMPLESGPGPEVLVLRRSSDCALLHTPVRAPRSSTPSVPRSDSTTWNCGLAKPEMSKSKHVARVAWKRRSELNALSEQECNPHSHAYCGCFAFFSFWTSTDFVCTRVIPTCPTQDSTRLFGGH